MKMIDVSIIIVNYNTLELTDKCIESIIKKTEEIKYEIILVDNASQDGSKDHFEKKKNIKYLYLNKNIGFGAGNNKGFEISRGRNIFFLNPDTELKTNAVKILSNFLDKHNKVGICGGNLINEEEKPVFSYSKIFPSILSEFDQGVCNFYIQKTLFRNSYFYNYTKKPHKVAFVSGANLMIKRYIFEEVGKFDERYFLYFEETILEKKVRDLGYYIYNIPEAIIYHYEGKSFSFKPERERRYFQNRKLFFLDSHNLFYYKLATILYKSYLKCGVFLYHNNKEKKENLKQKINIISNI